MPTPCFRRITIVGLGLIGGSLGMAARRHQLAREVVGVSRSQAMVRRAKARGAIDWGTVDARPAVDGADLVILAAPVDEIVPIALRVAPFLRAGSVLTDVGSTKARIVLDLERSLPRGVAFVGGHPLAGSEQRGIAAARAQLFEGSVVILTPTARTPRQAIRRVRRLWDPLVDDVITMSPDRHDRLLALTSHLPHLMAYVLTLAADASSLPRAPRSFLDATRVAKSDPDLWDDILLSNRASLLQAIRQFDRRWRALRTLLTRADRAALRQLLARAKARRDALEDC